MRNEWDKAEEEIHRRQQTGEVKAYAKTLTHSRQYCCEYDNIYLQVSEHRPTSHGIKIILLLSTKYVEPLPTLMFPNL